VKKAAKAAKAATKSTVVTILRKLGIKVKADVGEKKALEMLESSLAEGNVPESLTTSEVAVLKGLGYEVVEEVTKPEPKKGRKGKKAEP